ncbi:chemotaxis protein CheW [Actinomycetaceae bacterium L2_0104]
MSKLLVTFAVGDHFYGLPVERVQEVLPQRVTTLVPLAPADVAGLVNLRGQVVESLDLRSRLGLEPVLAGTERMSVVVRNGANPVSLVVDRIGDVAVVDETQFEEPPSTLDSSLRALIVGAYKLPGQLLLALDVDAVTVE